MQFTLFLCPPLRSEFGHSAQWSSDSHTWFVQLCPLSYILKTTSTFFIIFKSEVSSVHFKSDKVRILGHCVTLCHVAVASRFRAMWSSPSSVFKIHDHAFHFNVPFFLKLMLSPQNIILTYFILEVLLNTLPYFSGTNICIFVSAIMFYTHLLFGFYLNSTY